MPVALQIANRTISTDNLIPLLVSYELMPQLLCEHILDQATEPITCTAEEIAESLENLQHQWNFASEVDQRFWQAGYGLSQKHLEHLATRKLKREKFKQIMWGRSLETYFLQRKDDLDAVIYSLIRVKNQELAQELYFRLQEGEAGFGELAKLYSEGIEADTGGFLGPVELGELPPNLASCLRTGYPGEVQAPIVVDEWQVIVRLEKLQAVQLDDEMRQRLLQERFETWLQQQLEQLQYPERIWFNAA